jgi:glycosyltransferase involved in cell wall biosynthesis
MTDLTTAIPVFNGEQFLPATLECLARQIRKPDRLVVFDNGSSDGTEEIVKRFRAVPCEFRRNERNLGVLGNANRCLTLASETRFLHLLMADDLVTPDFYAKQIPALSEVSGRALGYVFNDEIDQHGKVIGPVPRRATGTEPRQVPLNEFLSRQASLATVLLPGVVLKTDYSPAPCTFRPMPQVGDGLFLAEWAVLTGTVVELPEYLCQYRLHPFNASSQHMYELEHFLVDEWRLAQMVLGWMKEGWPIHAARRFKVRCLLAARAQVKVDMMQALRPSFASELGRKRTGRSLGRWGWLAGRAWPGFPAAPGRKTLACRRTCRHFQR